MQQYYFSCTKTVKNSEIIFISSTQNQGIGRLMVISISGQVHIQGYFRDFLERNFSLRIQPIHKIFILTIESPLIMSIAFKQWHQVVHDLVVHSAVSQSLLAISFVDFCDHQHRFSDRYCDLCDRDGYNLSLLNSWSILPR